MGRQKKKKSEPDNNPRFRIKLHIGEDTIGPGKIELLRFIDQEGGISAAARRMNIPFRRAWHLIETINLALGEPVVKTAVGGSGGGSAKLTQLGKDLIAGYDSMLKEIEPSTKPFLHWIEQQKGATSSN